MRQVAPFVVRDDQGVIAFGDGDPQTQPEETPEETPATDATDTAAAGVEDEAEG